MSRFRPTFEQACILDAFATGEPVVVRALAGTGKTTTLRLLGESTRQDGAYLAYNRAIADDARGSFPRNVTCKTAHSFAFAAIGNDYADRLKNPRLPLFEVANALRLKTTKLEDRIINNSTVARIVIDTVAQFCYSADTEISRKHVPETKGIDTPLQKRLLADIVVPNARVYWEDLQRVDGIFKFEHDHYLKLWGLSNPRLNFDYILFDEAQDANPVIAKIVEDQIDSQRIAVGDANQAIYGWRGAIDAMDSFMDDDLVTSYHGVNFKGGFDLSLTQSFRFGVEIADAANYFLAQLPTDLRVVGTESIEDDVTTVGWPKAMLCRTNAGGLDVVLSCLDKQVPVALVGGAKDVVRFCKAADQLQAGKRTTHEDLCAFRTWLEVQEYVEDEDVVSDLGRMVKLVERYGTEKIINALERTVSEARAAVIVSTAHKAKGREWPSVRLHNDFERDEGSDDDPRPPSDPEIRLRYVAATRAMRQLDLGPLMRKYRPPQFAATASGSSSPAPVAAVSGA